MYVVCVNTKPCYTNKINAEPLFTKRTDGLQQDLVKFRSREIRCYNDRIALKLDRHLNSAAAEVPVKIQSDFKSLSANPTGSRLHKILPYP